MVKKIIPEENRVEDKDKNSRGPGQPKKFSPEEIELRAEQYFEYCEEEKVPITISALCYAIGFYGKTQLYEYEKYEGYSYLIKRLRLRVEIGYEKRLHSSHVAGAIFALTNIAGWDNKQEVKLEGPTSKQEVDELKLDIQKMLESI